MPLEDKFNQSEFEMNSREGSCSDIARAVLEIRERNPEKFVERAATPKRLQNNIPPVVDPFASNSKPPKPITEETDSFIQWKDMVYDFAKRLYGVEGGDIDDGMLRMQWSEGSTPEVMVKELGRKLGMEMIADPESIFK